MTSLRHQPVHASVIQMAESVSFAGSVLGAIAAVMTQQWTWLGVPAGATYGLGLINRRREMIAHTVNQRSLDQELVVRVKAQLQPMQATLEALQDQVQSVVESSKTQSLDQPRCLTHQHLLPITNKIQQIHVTFNQLRLGDIPALQKQIDELNLRFLELPQSADNSILKKEMRSREGLLPSAIKAKDVLPKRERSASENIAILVDASNMFHILREHQLDLDYSALFTELTQGVQASQVYIYNGIQNLRQQVLMKELAKQGYQIIEKRAMDHGDRVKTNLDMEIGLDLVYLSTIYSTLILVSGDGDFCQAVLQARLNSRVEVVSLKAKTSQELIQVADIYYNLAQLGSAICKPQKTIRAVSQIIQKPINRIN